DEVGGRGRGAGRRISDRLCEIVSQRVSSVSASSPRAAPITPVLLGLAFCGRSRRVLNLEPMVDPARAVVGAKALRHDALAAECARMPIASEMPIESNSVASASEEIGEQSRAVAKAKTERVKYREAAFVDDNRLAVVGPTGEPLRPTG